MAEGDQRRLAAIVSADVVGYSRLMGGDETGTLAAIREHRTALIDPLIAKHGGRLVKTMGDGLLLEFPSAVNAVACSVALQEGLAARNDGIAPDMRITYRIGVNLGDIITDGDDIHGDGVNVAARLETLADPGGICISAAVHEQLCGRLEVAFEDQGEKQVKNIERPVRVWRWSPRTTGSKPAPPALSDKPSIVVLPFINMSGDPEQEYFADGLTEDIISALSAWHYFPVVSRVTSFLFKGWAVDSRKVCEELKVRYVLEGSVRKSGNRIRISAQLNDAIVDAQVWAERFDRDMEDIFELQDEITRLVAAVVAPELEKAEARRILSKPPNSFGAWDSVQRGIALLSEFSKEGNDQARFMFLRAIEQDPDYSKAYTSLAYSYHRDIFWNYADDRALWIADFLKAAKRAVLLDDTDSSAHLVLGYAHLWVAEFDLMDAHLRRAVALNPGNAFAHVALGDATDVAGQPREALPLIEKGIEMNTRDPRLHTFIGALARVFLNLREYEEAVASARRALERRSDYPQANAYLISALGHLGRVDEAQLALKRCPRILPGFATAYRETENVEHYFDGLRKAGLAE